MGANGRREHPYGLTLGGASARGHRLRPRTKTAAVAGLMAQLGQLWTPRETPFAAYAKRPVAFCKEVLGVEPWSKIHSRTGRQEGPAEILEAIAAGEQRVAVKGGRGVSKSHTMATAAVWWLQTRPNSVVLTTAPTWDQVRQQIWREIRDLSANAKQPLLGRCLTTEFEIGEKWYAYGRATNVSERFLGPHAVGGLLLITDESPGVMEEIWDSCYGFFTNVGGCWLAGGNPTRSNCRFAGCWKPESDWRTFRINAEEAPEFLPTGESLVTDDWLEEQRKLYGPDYQNHPIYRSHVLGLEPLQDEDALFPLWLLERQADAYPGVGGRHMGVDIARSGQDWCVALCLNDGRVIGRERWNVETTGDEMPTMRTVAIILKLIEKWGVPKENVHIDVGSAGGGVIDRLRELGIPVDAVEFGGGARGDYAELLGPTTKFANRRSELYYAIRKLLEHGLLSIPQRYEMLWGDLAALQWGPDNKKGEVWVIPKDKVREKIHRSTDDSDALVCAISRIPHRRVGVGVIGSGRGRS